MPRLIAPLFTLCLGLLLVGCQTSPPGPGAASPADVGSVEERLAFVGSLFTGVEQYQNFNRLNKLFPSQPIKAPAKPFEFPAGATIELPTSYDYRGDEKSGASLLDETRTVALVVIQNGEVRFEDYWLTGGKNVNWLSMSVAKSFISTLVGIAIDDGLISGVETPITNYVPELNGSAYEKVRIKDVLQMSSGARWNEDYSDPESDIMRYGQIWAGAGSGSFDEFTATLTREREPGTYNYYNSTDTQALGMLLSRATGMSVSAYAEQELWQPLGMQNNGYWITDNQGVEMSAGGLLVTALDYAKLGQLFLQGGQWNGQQIVSQQWIRDSLQADAPHLQAEAHPDYPVGYGYQWWLPVASNSSANAGKTIRQAAEFAAIGVYNQFIYIDPDRELVIVKLSANPAYGQTNDESSFRELETFEYFRAIGSQFR